LELEITSRGEKIGNLQREIKQLSSSDIEIAFVESEKRRSNLEIELANAKTKAKELMKDLDAREMRLLEVDQKLESAQNEIVQRNLDVASRDKKCSELTRKLEELEKVLASREQRLMEVDSLMESKKKGSHGDQERIQELERSNQSLGAALERANEELVKEKDRFKGLEEAAERHQKESEQFYQDKSANEHKIKTLEDALQREIQSKNGLELDVAAVSETLAVTQRQNAELQRKLEERNQSLAIAHEELLETKADAPTPDSAVLKDKASLESQIAKLTTELALRDDEIRELRLVELKDAEETITSLTEEINALTEEALQKNMEKIAEKANLTAEIERLNDRLQSFTLQRQSQQQQFDTDSEAMASTINAMESSKRRLQVTIEELHDAICIRDGTIKSLREALSMVEQREMEMTDERNLLRAAEEEGREEMQNLKDEIESAIAREKEMAEIMLRNKDSLHKEELEHVLSELEAAKKKLKESEGLLEERSTLLGEMVDQNKELENRLEKEERDLRMMERKFAEGRVELERTKKYLKKCQEDVRRKESVLQSKLKEERENKEFAEESLRKLKTKYNEAIKTNKCVTDLERQNAELRDKIRRQEAFLQRKLEKDKIDRGRLTPTKGISGASPTKSSIAARTPSRRTGSSSSSGRIPPPASSVFTVPPRGSKLPGPSRSSVKKSAASPSSSRISQASTPIHKCAIPSTTDRSVTSELSSLLRSPVLCKDQRDDSPVVPSWEMDLE
jgi:chromosome segregation ATPase